MTGHPTVGRDRRLDRPPGELVAEAERVPVGGEQAGLHQPVEGRQDAVVEAAATSSGSTRSPSSAAHLERHPRVVVQERGSGEDGVAHRRGDLDVVAGEHLGEEERVAAGEAVELFGRMGSAVGQPSYAVGGERRQVDPARGPLPTELAEGDPQGVGRRQRVVAERDQEQDRQVA